MPRISRMRLTAAAKAFHGSSQSFIPHLNFMSIHYLYFTSTILVLSFIFWLCSKAGQPIDYVDCLFVVTSAMTETGLATINLSRLNVAQQVIVFCLMICGSPIFVSFFVVLLRKRAFELRLANVVQSYKIGRKEGIEAYRVGILEGIRGRTEDRLPNRQVALAQSDESTTDSSTAERRLVRRLSVRIGEAATSTRTDSQTEPLRPPRAEPTSFRIPVWEALSKNKTMLRSESFDLTREDRERLGGSEYGAVKLLTYLVPAYFIIWQLLGCLSTALYITINRADVATSSSLNPWWLGIFLGVSAFNNCGLSLLDAGVVPFERDIFLLISFTLMITAGNVAYPLLLRLFLWLGRKIFPKNSKYDWWRDTIKFILEYPRRVYTNIFPSPHTWWLLCTLIILTSIDWMAFSVLNFNNPAVFGIPAPYREAIAFFQSISIRSAGFSVVTIPQLAVSTQVISMVMMYISAYPVLITLRSSNIYEESSLGIYRSDLKGKEDPEKCTGAISQDNLAKSGSNTRLFFLRQQLQHQMSHDLWWLTLCAVAIISIESSNYDRDPVTYSIFNIVFEIVSAFGPVGISTGLPDQTYSLSGGFHIASKIILCAVMVRGRHRGLPVAIDKAVLLPGERADTPNREHQTLWVRGINDSRDFGNDASDHRGERTAHIT